MPMLDANDPAFRQRYPNGCIVRDRLGRQLWNVVACNPETGEAVRLDGTWLTGQWLRLAGRGLRTAVVSRVDGSGFFRWSAPSGGILRRHGFWPAPLTIEPRRWSRIMCRCFCEPLPALDNRTPEEICGYGDDGLCDHSDTP